MNPALQYLHTLWPDLPENQWICVFTLPDKQSHYAQSLDRVAEIAMAAVDRKVDVYLQMGLTGVQMGPFARASREDVTAIPGVWADIDLKDQTRNKSAFPATFAEANSIVPSDVPPTMLVATGGGYHAYWLFDEPFLIDSDEARAEAEGLLIAWQTLLRRRAQVHGWTLDYTQDLPRILRIPGTTNWKNRENPRLVSISLSNGPRYSPSDLRESIADSEFADRQLSLVEPAKRSLGDGWRSLQLVVYTNASVDPDMIDQMCAIEPKFRQTWHHDRPDLDATRGSFSEYDLALANFGVAAGMSVQVVCNLMVAFRLKHGGKAKHPDYYRRTIWMAMHQSRKPAPDVEMPPAGPRRIEAPEEPPKQIDEDAFDQQKPVDDATKIRRLEQVSQWLGLRVLQFVKVTGREPSYVIVAEKANVDIECMAKLLDSRFVRARIAALTEVMIPRMKADEWDRIVGGLLSAVTIKDAGAELEIEGEITMILQQYLTARQFLATTREATVHTARQPLVKDDRITVNTTDIQLYLQREFARPMSTRAIATSLSSIRAESFRIRVCSIDQTRWRLPEEWRPQDFGQDRLDDAA